MPRPNGMRRVDHARACFCGAWVAAGALITLLCLFIATVPVKAQGMKCAPYPVIEKSLTGPKYKEVKIATGISGIRQAVLFVSPDTGTFTFVVRLPNGLGCILGGGTNWKFHKLPERELEHS